MGTTTNQPGHSDSKNYFYGLDLLRFSAASLVAIFHLTWKVPKESSTAFFGWIGVQVFFVISGFVIANSASESTPSNFLKNRILRLYPAAIPCALISTFVLWAKLGGTGVSLDKIINSTFLWITGPWLTGAYWTLPIEISFYALIFFLLRLRKFYLVGRVACWLTLASTSYLIIMAGYTLGTIDLPKIDYNYGIINLTLLRHGPFFAIGIFIWLHSRENLDQFATTACLFAIAAGILEIWWRSVELASQYGTPLPVATVFGAAAVAWLISLLFLYMAERRVERFPRDNLTRWVVRRLGLMTYPLYLIHESVGIRVVVELCKLGVDRPVTVWLGFGCICALSFIIVEFIESPVRRWMRYTIEWSLCRFRQNKNYIPGIEENTRRSR